MTRTRIKHKTEELNWLNFSLKNTSFNIDFEKMRVYFNWALQFLMNIGAKINICTFNFASSQSLKPVGVILEKKTFNENYKNFINLIF